MGLHACPTFRHSLLKYLVLLQPIPSTHIFLRKIIPRNDFLILSYQECNRYNLRYIGAWSESEKQWCKPISMYIPVYSASFSIFNLFCFFDSALLLIFTQQPLELLAQPGFISFILGYTWFLAWKKLSLIQFRVYTYFQRSIL